jgi:predicted nucleic acid-binding protein
MIVVDTNIVAYLLIEGTHTKEARAAYLKDPEWCAPQLWRSELRSVLSLYIRKKQISEEAATDLMREAESILAGREYQVSSADIFSLVSKSQCSAYDCEFVALAKHLNVMLVTSDKQLLRAFPKIAIPLAEFTK